MGISTRDRALADDPLQGWRLPIFYAIGTRSDDEVRAVEQEIRKETYIHDPVVQSLVADAGRHRVYHDPDPSTLPERAGTLDSKYWSLLGLVDRLKFVHSLSPLVEVHIAVDRQQGSDRFNSSDVTLVEEVVHALEPWARRLALLHGYAEDCLPLSERERQIANALLGPEPLKAVAAELGMSEARGRELVRSVYHKLRVGGRIELQARWAGKRLPPAKQAVAATRAQRRN